MAVKFFDTTRQYYSLKKAMDSAAVSVLAGGQYILGENVAAFENACADYLGVKHAVGVANGSDALVIALDILGIGPGDEVITSPYTFFASAECISVRGALPVFADIDPVSYCIDPQSVAKLINSRTRAIIPVHIFGQPADMDALMSLAREHRLAVVEDCAQAIGAEYAGKRVGGFGDMGTFSFFPTKNLGGCGDGGMVVTNNPEYAEALKIKRVHGSKPKYYHKVLGYNSRLDELQAALLNVKLPYLDAWNKRRREIAMNYNEAFASLPVHRPMEKPGRKHIYHLYMLQVPDRDDFRRFLKEKGVETGLYYPVPLHLQEVYRDLGYKAGDLPVSEHASAHCVALPCYPELTDDEQNEVISAVKAYFSS